MLLKGVYLVVSNIAVLGESRSYTHCSKVYADTVKDAEYKADKFYKTYGLITLYSEAWDLSRDEWWLVGRLNEID